MNERVDPFNFLNIVLGAFFYKPDLQAIRIVLGAAHTHYLRAGDPVWIFLVGPTGTGESKQWQGKITIAAAVTPELDRHYSIFSTLGERFLQVRIHRPDSPEAGEKAIDQQSMPTLARSRPKGLTPDVS